MTLILTPDIITVFCLCVVAAFLFGFVAGISIEYHNSKQALTKQQLTENLRLRMVAREARLAVETRMQEREQVL